MSMNFQPAFLMAFVALIALQSATRSRSAQAPAPSSGPANVTAVLEKAGHYNTLIRLLKSTQVGDRIRTQILTNVGITLFAPTDAAFASLSPGTLNHLSDQQLVSLILFHLLPTYVSIPQFQTIPNPVPTQAGNGNGHFPLNVTASGSGNKVDITTGIVDTTITDTLFTDGQVAVYRLDKVLLPIDIFPPSLNAPTPAPLDRKGKLDTSDVNGKKMGVRVLGLFWIVLLGLEVFDL